MVTHCVQHATGRSTCPSEGTVVDAVTAELLPHVVPLGPNLWGASFRLMKLLPAHHVVRQAIDTGRLGPHTTIVESTSGTFGLALAMTAALARRRLTVVTDPAMDARLCRRLTDLGARIEMCSQPSARGEYQTVRLDRLREIRHRDPDTFWPRQYDNPAMADAYATVADHLLARLGRVDAIVGPVGSGGSMCGTVAGLRRHRDVQAVAVDTPGSVLFGQPDRPRELRGLGNSLQPGNLDHTAFDQVHWCPPGVAYRETRRLHRRHALFHGPTSGAALAVARWYTAGNPDRRTVVLLPDQGERYLDTVYDDAWLDAATHRRAAPAAAARRVSRPTGATTWTWLPWGRRRLADVTGRPDGQAS